MISEPIGEQAAFKHCYKCNHKCPFVCIYLFCLFIFLVFGTLADASPPPNGCHHSVFSTNSVLSCFYFSFHNLLKQAQMHCKHIRCEWNAKQIACVNINICALSGLESRRIALDISLPCVFISFSTIRCFISFHSRSPFFPYQTNCKPF